MKRLWIGFKILAVSLVSIVLALIPFFYGIMPILKGSNALIVSVRFGDPLPLGIEMDFFLYFIGFGLLAILQICIIVAVLCPWLHFLWTDEFMFETLMKKSFRRD